MQLTLVRNDVVSKLLLPEKPSGQFWVSYRDDLGHKVDVISVEGADGEWSLRSNRKASVIDVNGERVPRVPLELDRFYEVLVEATGEKVLIRTESSSEDRRAFKSYRLPDNRAVTIGRAESSVICFASRFVSTQHAAIVNESGALSVTDLDSANGTFVNGRRVLSQALVLGDVIVIDGLVVVLGRGFIAVNNPDGLVTCDQAVLVPMERQPIEPDTGETEEGTPSVLFHRSPRTKIDIVPLQMKIDPPPAPDNSDDMPVMMLVGPALTMGLSSLMMGAFAVTQAMRPNGGGYMSAMPTALMSLTMVGGMVLWPVLSRRYERKMRVKHELERTQKYGEYLEATSEVLDTECAAQSAIVRENFVTVSACIERIRNRDRDLWERVPSHSDFATVRLGIGSIPMVADIPSPERRFTVEEDDLAERMYAIFESPRMLTDVPVSLSLRDQPIVGITGDRARAMRIVEAMVIQLAALHSYDELKMVFVYGERESDRWDFARWMPHVKSDDGRTRFVAGSSAEAKELSVYLEREMALREQLGPDANVVGAFPHVVIFALDREIASRVEAINRIVRKGTRGFTVVTAYDELQFLPKECRAVVDIGDECCVYDPLDTTGRRIGFEQDQFEDARLEEIARVLANTKVETGSAKKVLPDTITFLDLFGVGRIEHLNALVRWEENNPVLSLEAPVGVDTNGEVFKLDIHEKYHGPHGLIAGMTGSGKSEFIMTYILSLALNYHPDEVSFVLIDYKGGGMANAFANLPHVAGTITNLDGAAVNRSLISLQSELKRRQAVFNEASERTGTSNIDIYKYQKMFRDGEVTEPLPHLLVISDEFAELKSQQPDFMTQLVSAARIGRSLGVHLILATQKPAGVVDDQIWSNSRFRVCLKVQENADSMEVIKRPDAASLSNVGRYYVQVGFNELFELGQSAWSGAPYYPTDFPSSGYDDSVVLLSRLGQPLKQARPQVIQIGGRAARKQLDEVTAYIERLAAGEGARSKALWLEPIPGRIYLNEVAERHDLHMDPFVLDPLVGEYDDPANQRQLPMRVSFSEDGNVILYGAAGSGKTTFLTTMLFSLMASRTPDHLHIYVLDFGAETLRAFQSAPHVGEVVFSHEVDKVENLFTMLKDEVSRRKRILSESGGDFEDYRSESGQPLPAILVAIHNYSAFSEMFEEQEDVLSFLSREGTKYGIYFIATSAVTSAIRYRIQQNFKQMILLQMNDSTEYGGVLGNTEGVVPSKLAGRGVFRAGSVYEFQTALVPMGKETELAFVRRACSTLSSGWDGERAPRIPILPDCVTPSYFAEEIRASKQGVIPVGVDKRSLLTVRYDFAANLVSLVLSRDDESVNVVTGLAEALALQYGANAVVLDGGSRLGLGQGGSDGPGYTCVTGEASTNDAVAALVKEAVERFKARKRALDSGQPATDFEKRIYVIPSLSALRSNLEPAVEEGFLDFLEKCDSTLGLNLVIAETATEASTLEYQSWAKNNLAQDAGVYVGDGFSEQFVIRPSKTSSAFHRPVGDDFAYVVVKGRASLVKVLVSDTAVIEEGWDE